MDNEHTEEARKPPVIQAPPQMTREEWMRHQVTHTPYAPSCRHCVAARAVRDRHPRRRRHHHLVPDIDGSHTGPNKISMDYMYLSERKNGDGENKNNPPHLVVVDHRHGRVWAHRVPNKGIMGKAEWVPRRVLQDVANNGMQDIVIELKIDQEPAIVNVQTAIQEMHPNKVIPVNSPVGESECNGRVENAIKRIQEKVRTIRHQIEHNIKCKIFDEAPIISWLVRLPAELIFKY